MTHIYFKCSGGSWEFRDLKWEFMGLKSLTKIFIIESFAEMLSSIYIFQAHPAEWFTLSVCDDDM